MADGGGSLADRALRNLTEIGGNNLSFPGVKVLKSRVKTEVQAQPKGEKSKNSSISQKICLVVDRIKRQSGVWGKILQPGTEYKDRIAWYEDGTLHSFWISLNTEARSRLQKVLQTSLQGAEPLPS